jgi:hypothetical protein
VENFLVPLFGHQDYLLTMYGTLPVLADGTLDPHTLDNPYKVANDGNACLPQQSSPVLGSGGMSDSGEAEDDVTRFSQHVEPMSSGVKVCWKIQSGWQGAILHEYERRHLPIGIQRQYQDLFIPTWAVMTDNSRPNSGLVQEAFARVYTESTEMIKAGASLNEVAGAHPNMRALFDKAVFMDSPVVTKWAARMVFSTTLRCKYCTFSRS